MRILSLVAFLAFSATIGHAQILTPILTGQTAASGSTCGIPSFSPSGGTYNATQSVTIASSGGCTVCYNTTGNPSATVPGTCDGGSTTYTTPVSVSSGETLTAIGTKLLYTNSASNAATYAFACDAPIFSPAAGAYGTSQSVAITSATGCTICYREDGTNPAATTPGTCDAGSTTGTPATVASSLTLKAIGTLANYTNSSVTAGAYTIGFTFSLPNGVQQDDTDCASGTTTVCKNIITSSGSGSVGLVFVFMGGSGKTTTGASSAGGGSSTWTECTNFPVSDSGGGGTTIDCYYTNSLTAATTSVTVTLSVGSSGAGRMSLFYELAGTGTPLFDASNKADRNSSASTQSGIGLTLGGTINFIAQVTYANGSTVSSINGAYSGQFLAGLGSGTRASAYSNNTTTATAPTWNYGGNVTAAVGAVSFKQ